MEAVGSAEVYETLRATLSQDNNVRLAAEQKLKRWEADAVPGFVGSLLSVAIEPQNVPEVSPASPTRQKRFAIIKLRL
jgi:hypothetical protein